MEKLTKQECWDRISNLTFPMYGLDMRRVVIALLKEDGEALDDMRHTVKVLDEKCDKYREAIWAAESDEEACKILSTVTWNE